jgi:hypothetical protein
LSSLENIIVCLREARFVELQARNWEKHDQMVVLVQEPYQTEYGSKFYYQASYGKYNFCNTGMRGQLPSVKMKICVEVSLSQLFVKINQGRPRLPQQLSFFSPFMGWVSHRAVKRWSSEC